MATDICVQIGRRIRTLRLERGWTQAMLADHAELTREHLSELENGHKEIGIRALSRITNALELTFSEFFAKIVRVRISRHSVRYPFTPVTASDTDSFVSGNQEQNR